MSKVPASGDTVTLESPAGTTIGSVVYDGRPSIDSTVCSGSTNFSGQRSEGEEVEGGYFTEFRNRYGESRQKEFGKAQVTTLSGSSYSGNFLSALSSGQTVFAKETAKTTIGGGTFEYSSETVRPVEGCPAPPPPPPPPPAPILPPALQGSLVKLVHITIHKLLKLGWADQVAINQAGTVTQDLYLLGGVLPAHAASARGRRHKPRPALLLARGVTKAAGAGDVTVHLALTKSGRRRLRNAHSARVVLITTLRTAGGQVLNLARHSVLLHR